jgi:hypothetical protein
MPFLHYTRTMCIEELAGHYVDGIKVQDIKQQLLLGVDRMVSEALRQTLKLEVVKLAVRSSIRL